MADEDIDLAQFPIDVDKKHRIDRTLPAVTGNKVEFQVYTWAERPDADQHIEGDKEHWCLDSVHDSPDKAKARVKELKAGTKAKRLSDDLHAKSQAKTH